MQTPLSTNTATPFLRQHNREPHSLIDHLARPIIWSINYTGPLAPLVKAIPLLAMLICVSSPGWGYVFWLNLALKIGEPWNYGLYVIYIIVSWVIVPCLGVVIGYILQKARDTD
ncbi:MAG: hypothetical protein QXJ02_06075 [Candidatus Bathyarchaeia archaeon]